MLEKWVCTNEQIRVKVLGGSLVMVNATGRRKQERGEFKA